MTKDQLIRKVLDSATSGNSKDAYDAIDEHEKENIKYFIEWLYADESRFEDSSNSNDLAELYLQTQV